MGELGKSSGVAHRKKAPAKPRKTYVQVVEDPETFERNERIRERIQIRQDELGRPDPELAKRMGTTSTTVWRLKKRYQGLSMRWVRSFAAALDWSVNQLVDEGNGAEGVTVPVVGYVGAAARVFNYDDRGDIGRVEPPEGAEHTVSVIVEGDSMVPRYWPGQHLFFRPTQGVAEDCIGRPCICQVVEGPTLVKILQRGDGGLYRLVSVNRPEVEDAALLWAARVLWTKEP